MCAYRPPGALLENKQRDLLTRYQTFVNCLIWQVLMFFKVQSFSKEQSLLRWLIINVAYVFQYMHFGRLDCCTYDSVVSLLIVGIWQIMTKSLLLGIWQTMTHSLLLGMWQIISQSLLSGIWQTMTRCLLLRQLESYCYPNLPQRQRYSFNFLVSYKL